VSDTSDPLVQFHHAGVQFLITELELGLTFMDVATATSSEDTVRRNYAHALQAYQTVIDTKPRLALTAADAAHVDEKLAELKLRLEKATVL
jgi:hypothetical protein